MRLPTHSSHFSVYVIMSGPSETCATSERGVTCPLHSVAGHSQKVPLLIQPGAHHISP